MISVRRFRALLGAESLVATGTYSPRPEAVTRAGGTPLLVRRRAISVARRALRSQLSVRPAVPRRMGTLSVWPSTTTFTSFCSCSTVASFFRASWPLGSTLVEPDLNSSCSDSDTYTLPSLSFTCKSLLLKLSRALLTRVFRSVTAWSLSARALVSSVRRASRVLRSAARRSLSALLFCRVLSRVPSSASRRARSWATLL